MAHVTPQLLEGYLAAYGWNFEALDGNVWRTGFDVDGRVFPMQIKLSATCVSFEVTPWAGATLEGREASDLSRDLLELNGRLQLVKLGLDQDGEILLSCQVLAAGFDFDMLSHILGIIGYYAEELAPMLQERFETLDPGARPPLLS